jgi:hypothetical protein
MSPTPIGAFFGAVRGAAKPTPATDEGAEGVDFGMALGLAITNRQATPASTPQAKANEAGSATNAEAPSGSKAWNGATQSAPSASGAVDASSQGPRGAILRALVLDLGQALGADLANGALVDGEPGAIALDPALMAGEDGSPAQAPAAPLRALASALPVPSSPDVGASISLTPPAAASAPAKLARPARVSGPTATIAGALASSTATEPIETSTGATPAARSPEPGATIARAEVARGASADPNASATPAIQAGADHRGRARREANDSAPASESVLADEAAPITAPPAGATGEATRSGKEAASLPQGTATIPRDLASALDAASVAPRRALDQVTLPFEGENGLEGRLRIALRGNALHATIVAPDSASAARIEGAMGELHRALVERGFSDVRLAVQHAPAAAAEDERARSDRRDDARGSNDQRKARDDERTGSSHQQHRRRRDERGQEG